MALRDHGFRTLAENLPDYVVRYDMQGRKIYLNSAALGLFGAESAFLIGQTTEESHAASTSGCWPQDISRAIQRTLASGEPEEIEISFGLGTGVQRVHRLRLVAECGMHGGVEGVLLIGRDMTEHKFYEQSLLVRAEQGQYMSEIAANLPGFVYTFRESSSGVFSLPYVSPRFWEEYGLESSDHVNALASIAKLVPPEYQLQVLEQIAKSTHEMSVFNCTFLLNVPQRGERWISACSMPHQEVDGSVLWYGVMLDVTEQMHLERQLQLSQFALDRAHEAFYLSGADQRFIYVNEEACRVLGYRRDELLGRTASDIDLGYTPEMAETISEKMTLEGRAVFETRHRRCDGSVFPVEIRMALFEYQGLSFVATLARDMTEQKQAEEGIASREREFRTLAESLPDHIVRYDRNAKIVYVNPSLERARGCSAADIVGTSLREWYSDGSFEAHAQALDAVLATGKDCAIEIFVPNPLVASDVIHQIRLVAERDENGDVIGVLAIGRDISVLKRSERELQASRHQLRGLIASRETALELERKRIAREVHDELGQLLTGLQMKVSRLARNCAGNRPALCVQMHEALQLSEKALSVARNVASALRPAVLDMGIVTALEWLVDRFGINTGVHCQLHIAKGYLQLNESQSTALFRITQESLTNVARHAQADRVDIVLHKTAQEYVLKIRDNGVGFNRTIKKVGTFGLVGIHERVLMLGGEVDVNSGLEKGTEIVVRLPIEERQETL